MIDTVARFVLGLPAWVALLVVFLMPALESSAFVGFVFPGEIALILGGVLAFEHVVPLWAVLAAGIAGAVVGDSVGYAVGRRYGRRMVDGTFGRWVNHEHLDRGERYLAQRGGKAVFVGRYTAALRVMIPGLAGMARMPYGTFAAYNVAGGVSWATLTVLLGYVGGSSWRRVEHLASRISLAVLAVVVVLVAATFLVRRARAGWGSRFTGWLLRSAPVRRTTERFPRPVAWVGRRFEPGSWTGLPLTVLVVIGVGAVWSLLGVTQDVVAHEELARFDPRVHAWVVAHRVAWLTPVMKVASWLGASAVLTPVLLAVAVVVGRARRSWLPVVDVVVVYGWTLVTYSVMKQLVQRDPPLPTDRLVHAAGWAYPSGEVTQATAAFGIVCVLVCVGRPLVVKGVLSAAAGVLVLLVAYSQLYLGVHWLTDVLGAMCAGVAVLAWWGTARLTVLFSPSAPVRTPVAGDGPRDHGPGDDGRGQ